MPSFYDMVNLKREGVLVWGVQQRMTDKALDLSVSYVTLVPIRGGFHAAHSLDNPKHTKPCPLQDRSSANRRNPD